MMDPSDLHYSFGPVPSRRLGRSLGINNIPVKVCSYSCVYCQIGKTSRLCSDRKRFYEPGRIFTDVRDRVARARALATMIFRVLLKPSIPNPPRIPRLEWRVENGGREPSKAEAASLCRLPSQRASLVMHAALERLLAALDLEPAGENAWVATHPNEEEGHLFGGQVLAQGLSAVQRSAGADLAHSLHAYFLARGTTTEPIRFEVRELRRSRAFRTSQVFASQSVGPILHNDLCAFKDVAYGVCFFPLLCLSEPFSQADQILH